MIKLVTILAFALILTACSNGGDSTTDYSPSELALVPFSVSFPFQFSAEDLHGNSVTHSSLGEKELFFVYFWTTWCPACVNGMPGLVELANEYSDRIGFMTLLGDFDTNREVAITITEASDAPFVTVDARHSDFVQLMQLVNSGVVPTSVIIDGYGNVVGEQIIGSRTDVFRTAIEDALAGYGR